MFFDILEYTGLLYWFNCYLSKKIHALSYILEKFIINKFTPIYCWRYTNNFYICSMDEDEELYREMNEEDPFYMGDKDDDDDNDYIDDETEKSRKNNNTNNAGSGCLSVFVMFIVVIFLASMM